MRQPDFELGAQDLALRAMPGVLSLDQDGNTQALDLLERAMQREPDHALATGARRLGAYGQRVVYHFSSDPDADRARSVELARKARALAGDATVLAILGNALTLLDDLDSADLVIRKALAIDGGSAWAWSRSGWIDVYRGEPDSAIERFRIALELAPDDCLAFNSMVGHRLRAFQGRQLSRCCALAAARADRASLVDLGAPDPVSVLCARRRAARGEPQPDRAAAALSRADASPRCSRACRRCRNVIAS